MQAIPELDTKGLRRFGLQFAALIALFFGLLLPWLFGFTYPLWPWLAGGAVALWSLLAPDSLDYLYRPWMRFGLLLGRITSPIVLGILFFLVFTPAALVLKLLRKKLMPLEPDPAADTYYRPRSSAKEDGDKALTNYADPF